MPWLGPIAALGLTAAAGVGSALARRPLADLGLALYAGGIVLGPPLAFAWQRARGGRGSTAALAAAAIPAAWMAKECYETALVFGAAPALYYAFNPIHVGLVSWEAVSLAAVELVLRRRRAGRWIAGGVPGAVCAGFLLLALTTAVFIRLRGALGVFDLYLAGFRWLFGR